MANSSFCDKTKHSVAGLVAFYRARSSVIGKSVSAIFIAVLAFVVYRYNRQMLDAFRLAAGIGWKIVFLPLLFLIWNCFAALAWKGLLETSSGKKRIGFWKLYIINIEAQALNFVLPVSGIGGSALRCAKTCGNQGLKKSTTAVVLDKTNDIMADMTLAIFGLLACINILRLTHFFYAVSFVVLVLIAAAIIFWKKLWRIAYGIWPFSKGKMLISVLAEDSSLSFSSRKSYFFHFAEHVLIACEIYFVALMLGINLDLRGVLIVNAASSAFNLLFIMLPGRIGAFECSTAFAFSILSLSPAAGVSVALIRRARQVLVCMAGLLFMIYSRKTPGISNRTCDIPAVQG
jgi:uncharacterized membrane protein YbhN (UPF0104 family)